MSTSIVLGQRTWSMTRDENSYREYKVKFLVRGDPTDGPAAALLTPGLPLFGSQWLIDADFDVWAWCRWDAVVTPVTENEPNSYWTVEFTFSTKPLPPNSRVCNTAQTDNPLLEPQKISGSFTRYQEEAAFDRFGNPVVNAAWEQLRGPQVEFDKNRPQVKIEQNVINLDLGLCALMVDRVNAFPLWGLPERTIKLSNFSWERKFFGQCFVYYTRSFEFDIRYETFDRLVLNEGTRALRGHWDPDTGHWVLEKDKAGLLPNFLNPQDFCRYKDKHDENTRVILGAAGVPSSVIVDIPDSSGSGFISLPPVDPLTIFLSVYQEADFLLLGIPLFW